MTDLIETSTFGRVRLLELNRPDTLNSFNDALYDAVTSALTDAEADNTIAAVVLTGRGRAFSAGQDLTEMGNKPKHTDNRTHGFAPFIDKVSTFQKPLIAAVNGIGIGIGLTILLHCDLVLISEDARLRAPFVSLGVTAEAASSYLLPQRIGWQEAAQILYSADWVDADRAVKIGLAWQKAPAEALLENALEIAAQFAAMPIPSLIETKRLLQTPKLADIEAARTREVTAFDRLRGTPANLEAIAAFKEKRQPDFSKIGAS